MPERRPVVQAPAWSSPSISAGDISTLLWWIVGYRAMPQASGRSDYLTRERDAGTTAG